MHFSISETEECKDDSGSYTLYKIFINGAHHCSVRFSQLHNLNDQLKQEFEELMPSFPPKKIFGLSFKEKEERRLQLEKYLQQISQIPKILASDCFINFLINSQKVNLKILTIEKICLIVNNKETQRENETDVDLSVYLMNFEKLTINIKSYDQTEEVLQKLMNKIKLNPNFILYFGLFLVKKDDEDSIKIVRKLQDFESPFISLKAANKVEKHKIILRKSIFDLNFELELYDDDVAVNLLYIQAVDELANSHIVADSSVLKQLEQLQQKNFKKEFIKLISIQKFYGYLHFKSCISNYPEQNTKVVVALGNRNLYFKYKNKKSEEEIFFKVTRIKCWKVTGVNTIESSGKFSTHLELSFEYLFSKNELKWINLKTDQAILISMSLQSMVDEIILKKDGKSIKKLADRTILKSTPFMTRQKSLINNNANNSYNRQRSETESTESSSNLPKDYNKNDLFENEEFITNDDL